MMPPLAPSRQVRSIVDLDAAREAENRCRVREAWASYIRSAPCEWTHWMVGTFDLPRTAFSAWKYINSRWLPDVSLMLDTDVKYVAVLEGGEYHAQRHLHALLADTADIPIRALRDCWHAGHVQIRVVDARRNAARYLSKSLGNADSEVEYRFPHDR
jgi:hypothetical protein